MFAFLAPLFFESEHLCKNLVVAKSRKFYNGPYHFTRVRSSFHKEHSSWISFLLTLTPDTDSYRCCSFHTLEQNSMRRIELEDAHVSKPEMRTMKW